MLSKPGAPGEDDAPRSIFDIGAARSLLEEKMNTTVDKDDPVMMAVHLHHGFLGDYEKMLDRHGEKVKQAMAVEIAALVKTAGEAVEGLRDEALKSSLSQTLAKVAEQAKLMEAFKEELMKDLRRTVARQITMHGLLTLVTAGAAVAALANI